MIDGAEPLKNVVPRKRLIQINAAKSKLTPRMKDKPEEIQQYLRR